MASRISTIWNLSPPRRRVPRTPWTCFKTTLNSMIGRIRTRIQDRQPRALFQFMGGTHWLWVGVALSAAAIAGPPTPSPQQGTQPPVAAAHVPPQGPPEGDFIEFLGGDDVGD